MLARVEALENAGYVKQSDLSSLSLGQNITMVDAWTNTGNTNPSTITLSENIDDYDLILIKSDDGDGYLSSQIYKTSNISLGSSKIGACNNDYCVWYGTSSTNKNQLTYMEDDHMIIKVVTLININ